MNVEHNFSFLLAKYFSHNPLNKNKMKTQRETPFFISYLLGMYMRGNLMKSSTTAKNLLLALKNMQKRRKIKKKFIIAFSGNEFFGWFREASLVRLYFEEFF